MAKNIAGAVEAVPSQPIRACTGCGPRPVRRKGLIQRRPHPAVIVGRIYF